MRAGFRILLRLVLLFFWTVGCFVARLAAFSLLVIGADTEQTTRSAVFRFWAKGACFIAGARVRVEGPLPQRPYLLVSNHVSYFDPVVYARLLGCVFVSMAEVGGWPLIGTLARGMNTLFIDRRRLRDAYRVKNELSHVVASGQGALIFPESTTSYGDGVLPFRPALLEAAVASGRPVHFAALRYTTFPGDPTAEEAICWVDDTPFAQHALRLLRLRRFTVTVSFGDAAIYEPDRKALATSLHTAVASRLALLNGQESALTPAP